MFGNKAEIIKLKEALVAAGAKINELETGYNSIRAVLESMVEGVIIVDRDTRITSLNSSVEKIFGIIKKETEGKFFLEVIRNNDIAEVISNALKNQKFIHSRPENRTLQGADEQWPLSISLQETAGFSPRSFISQELKLLLPIQGIFQVNASPILEGNKVNGCLIVIHDITQIRRLEQVRSDFVANVSHELKTPLTAIKGFVETLLEGALEDKENSRKFLQIIQEHTNRLNSLINDLLDLSSLESKEITLEKKEANIKDLTDGILVSFESQLKKKSVVVNNEIPADLVIRIDKEKISQVLTNFIDNAVKFNRQNGSIKIYSQDLGSKIKIIVGDTGIGIPPKDIPRIFERFYRVDKARSRELGGTGLGLSIVKHIVELHDGLAGVESTEGLGSKFYFCLPK